MGSSIKKCRNQPFIVFLIRWLHDALLRMLAPGLMLSIKGPIVCAESEPEPDLAVLRGKPEDFKLVHPHTAELVIEVCVTSHEYDRSKLGPYAEAGVKEVWLVLAPEKQVIAFRRPVGGQYTERELHGPSGRVVSESVAEIGLDLDALFAS